MAKVGELMKLHNLVLCAAIGAATVYGQTGLATITGTITDATGAAVANAPIVVHNLDTGRTFAAASSDTGNYTVSQLPIGDYELTVTVSGFKKYSHTKFHLAAGQTMREDVALQVGQSTESVTVSAESSLLQTESSELVDNFTLKQLDDLPLLTVGATNDGVRDYFSAPRGCCLECSIAIAGSAARSPSPSSTELRTIHLRLDWMARP